MFKIQMIVKKKERPIEIEERTTPKIDLALFRKRPSSKSASGIILTYAKKFRKLDNLEMTILFQELYKQVKSIETSAEFRAKQWRGKSGVKFITHPDKVISVRYRRAEPNEAPKEVRMELLKENINKVIWAISQFSSEWVETSDIAEKVYSMSWQKVFANRQKHTHLVEILNYLEYIEMIEYSRSGKVKVIQRIFQTQKNI